MLLALVTTLESLSKSLLRLLFVVILGVGGWFGYSYYSGEKGQIKELGQQLEARHREVAKLTEEVKDKSATSSGCKSPIAS